LVHYDAVTHIFHSLRVSALAWILLGLTSASLGARDFYVAPQASAGDGSKRKPFSSLEQGRDAVRLWKQGLAKPETATIWLADGDYLRTNALKLGPEDSGTIDKPITWRARNGGKARLVGGQILSSFSPVVDSTISARLPEISRDRVVQARVAPQGQEFAGLQSRGFARPTVASHPELFFAGKPMVLARWPNAGGFEFIAGSPKETSTPDGHGGQIGGLQGGFFYQGDRPSTWQDPTNVWVHGYWAWDWANSYERIAELDLKEKRIKTAPPYGHYGYRKGQRIYFVNILEELDAPGEWFLDSRTGILYFWPPEDETAGTTQPEALISMLGEPFLVLDQTANVQFLGITFEAARGNGIEINGGASNLIAGCTLKNLGNYGVRIQSGFGSRVQGCNIFETGDGGVSMSGGDRATLIAGGHVVENNHFRGQGRWSKCYVPAVLMEGVGMIARRNLIHDHPHCAILFSGNDHLIEGNEIHHIALETGDVGAIYTGRDYTYRGNQITNNYIHHTGGVGMGSMGVYMDDCVSGTEISGNIFYRVHRAVFLGGGRDHPVINNLFVECDPAVEIDGRGADRFPVWRKMVDETMRERLMKVPSTLYRERYPAMKSLDAYYGPPEGPSITGEEFKGVPPEGNVVSSNLYIGKWLKLNRYVEPRMASASENKAIRAQDLNGPLDETAPPQAFTLGRGARSRLGFAPPPVDRIGIHSDKYRRMLRE
jgi:hypothetical protein